MDPRLKAALVKDWAVEAGFDGVGVASLRVASTGGYYLHWLAAGHHAGMSYLARRAEVRLDPRRIFDGARSAVCVALQYGSDDAEANDLWRGVSRYARGDDYHDLMGRMLETLSHRMEQRFPEVQSRWYVDTGPVLERELGAAAGLGAVGKNTCLLHPAAGSWFFLGEILTSLDLAPDSPIADLCGSCSRCLDECPTDALRGPFELDSRLCISYWTIEHRGPIPHDVRPLLGEWVFGCDICQEVCPLNQDAPGSSHPGLAPDSRRSELDLVGLLSLEVEEYRRRFRGSPMKRAKLAGLKRNAIVAMGNSGRSGYVAPLERCLREEDDDLRAAAAWALGRIGGPDGRSALERAARSEESLRVLDEIRAALDALAFGS